MLGFLTEHDPKGSLYCPPLPSTIRASVVGSLMDIPKGRERPVPLRSTCNSKGAKVHSKKRSPFISKEFINIRTEGESKEREGKFVQTLYLCICECVSRTGE